MQEEDLVVACMPEEDLVGCMREEDLAECMQEQDLAACMQERDLGECVREEDLAACMLDLPGCRAVHSVALVVVVLGVPLSLGPALQPRADLHASLPRGHLLGREIGLCSTIG